MSLVLDRRVTEMFEKSGTWAKFYRDVLEAMVESSSKDFLGHQTCFNRYSFLQNQIFWFKYKQVLGQALNVS